VSSTPVEALDLRHRRSKELRPSTFVATTAARPTTDRRVLAEGRRRDDREFKTALRSPRQSDQVVVVDYADGRSRRHVPELVPKLTLADLIRDSQGMISPRSRATSSPATRAACSCWPAPAHDAGADDRRDTTRILEGVLAAIPTVIVDRGSHLATTRGSDRRGRRGRGGHPGLPHFKSVHAFFEFLGRPARAPSRLLSSTRRTPRP
jgi:hypothetical protein